MNTPNGQNELEVSIPSTGNEVSQLSVETVLPESQLRLFKLENPLKSRLGANFFKQLPKHPGVYWMLDGRGRLLYVGKSKNLKQRLTSYRSLKPENLPSRLVRVLLGTEHIGFERTESEPKATAVESALLKILKPPCNRAGVGPERVFEWIVREMPRSWRLEVQTHDTSERDAGFKAAPRVFKAHGALLRQLHGLVRGHFSIMELPTGLLKGPAGLAGVYIDRDMNDDLAGTSAEDKRVFNQGLRETTQMFLDGIEPWPEFPCPLDDRKIPDRWSADLWERDQAELKASFEHLIRPLRARQLGIRVEDFGSLSEST
jgi:hypothetical protein